MNAQTDRRVVIHAPAGRDAELARAILERASIETLACADPGTFCLELEAGAAAGIVTEAALRSEQRARLVEVLAAQAAWSELPIIVLVPRARGEDARHPLQQALSELGNTTLLERPLHPETLLNATRAALRARDKQYQVRELLFRLEQAVQERDRFLATLSHELRNPLGAIRNALHVVRRAGLLTSSLERPLTIVDRQVTHLARLVDDLLDVSRVTTGKIILADDCLDLRSVLQQSLAQLEAEFAEHELTVSTTLGSEALWVIGDAVRLEQVVTNLLTNSLKYTTKGGRVELCAGRDSTGVWARVVDDGIGIEAALLNGIFDMFSQVDRSLDRSQGGMGIGLTLVKGLIEMHGGSVEATSPGLGQGSTFTLRLPAVEPRTVVPIVLPRRAWRERTRQRILLIEDSEDNREMMRELLESDGFHVEVACSGQEGVERALTSKPDIAIVDIGLPVLDGYEVARRVRAVLGSTIQLVALTGYGRPEDRQRTIAAGFDIHLTKPVHPDELESALAQGS